MNQGFEYVERVGPGAGRSVLDHLANRYRHSSREQWQGRIAAGQVLLEGRVARGEELLRAGQTLVWRRPPWTEPLAPLGFAVLHRDDALLAVAKPSGLPTLPGGGFLEHTLLHQVRRRYPGATPAHRLGRGTSGLVLMCRTKQARRAVTTAFREGRVEKVYRALAQGDPGSDAFDVDAPIGPAPHPLLGTLHAARADGLASRSRVRVLERRTGCCLVEVQILTGRPHQIRIHLAAAAHPLVGETLYAPGGTVVPGTHVLPGDCGYWLHSHRLTLPYPDSGEPLDLECPPPAVLRLGGRGRSL